MESIQLSPSVEMIEYADARRVADMLSAIADPVRLMVLYRLIGGPLHVGGLAQSLGIPMVNMSHHLGVLRQSGLLDDQKDGRRVIYSLRPDIVVEPASPNCLAVLVLGTYRLSLMANLPTAVPGAEKKRSPRRPSS